MLTRIVGYDIIAMLLKYSNSLGFGGVVFETFH